jgi:hypothetical protein
MLHKIETGMPFLARKSRTYTGAAGLGAQGTTTLFTVTGDVMVFLIGTCVTDLVGATATLQIGTPTNTSGLVNQTATNIDANEAFQYNGTPASLAAMYDNGNIVCNGEDIKEVIGTADITAGSINLYCFWRPLSTDGMLVAA